MRELGNHVAGPYGTPSVRSRNGVTVRRRSDGVLEIVRTTQLGEAMAMVAAAAVVFAVAAVIAPLLVVALPLAWLAPAAALPPALRPLLRRRPRRPRLALVPPRAA